MRARFVTNWGNASKICASIWQDTAKHNRGELESPVVLLNSEYQLLNYIIDEQLKRIVEQANVTEQEQDRGRQGRSVNMTCQKCILSRTKPTDKASESIKSTSNSENAFNAMSLAALWHVINLFRIPDVDLLEQIYDRATVRLASNDAESATITFDTGVST